MLGTDNAATANNSPADPSRRCQAGYAIRAATILMGMALGLAASISALLVARQMQPRRATAKSHGGAMPILRLHRAGITQYKIPDAIMGKPCYIGFRRSKDGKHLLIVPVWRVHSVVLRIGGSPAPSVGLVAISPHMRAELTRIDAGDGRTTTWGFWGKLGSDKFRWNSRVYRFNKSRGIWQPSRADITQQHATSYGPSCEMTRVECRPMRIRP